jgi:hypothetical protein
MEPGKGSKEATRLHYKDTDWTAFMRKKKITEVKTHN